MPALPSRRLFPLLLLLLAAGSATWGPATGSARAQTPGPALAIPMPAPSSVTGEVALGNLTRGQKGVGYSVFAGGEPETFEVEVLGVLRGHSAANDVLIARLAGQGLEKSGVVAGMSGSPVYFDGKLAGAVAFSYLFSAEPIAGITAIGSMHQIPAAPPRNGAPLARSLGAAPLATGDLIARKFDRARFDSWLDSLKPAAAANGRSALNFTAAGFGEGGLDLLRGFFPSLHAVGAMAAGGQSPLTAVPDRELRPGDAVAFVLVQGDLSLAGHGTVTDRQGDQVVAFGHPVFGLGPVRVPMAASEVVTVFPSIADSFKMSNIGRLIGTFTQDRQAGLRGELGPAPEMTPVTVSLRVAGREEAPREYHMTVAPEPILRPLLLTVSALGAVTHGDRVRGFQSVDFAADFDLGPHGKVHLEQSFDGDQPVLESLGFLSEFARYFEFNDIEALDVRGLEVDFVVHDQPRAAEIVAAWPERRRVAPGEKLGLQVELQTWRGERERRRIEVEIPEVANGRFYLLIGDGTSADAARLELEKNEPREMSAILDQLRKLHTRRSLHVLGLAGGKGLVVEGRAMPDLPGGARALLAAEAGAQLDWRLVGETIFDLDRPLSGMVRVDLEVRRPKSEPATPRTK